MVIQRTSSAGKTLGVKPLGQVGIFSRTFFKFPGDIFDPHPADNYDHLADKDVLEKIPTWPNDLLYAKVFSPLHTGENF